MSRAVRRVLGPVLLALLVGVGADVGLVVLEFEPVHERVLALALALGGVVALLVAARGEAPTWETSYQRPTLSAGHDQRVATYVRVIEDHRTASRPGPDLQRRLRRLAEQTRATRHGTDAQVGWSGDLARLLDGPPRRWSGADLETYLTQVEGL